MKESLQNIVDIIAEPSVTFTRLKSKPRCGVAFVIIFLVFIGVTWATAPFLAHVLSHDEGWGSNTSKAKINRLIIGYAMLGILALLIGIIVLSGLLTIASRLFKVNRAFRFKHIFASLIHITLITSFGSLVNTALLLVFKRPRDTHKWLDMEMVPSLHHMVGFLRNEKFLECLSNINLLTLWEIAVLAIAIKVLTEIDRTRALFAATVIWLIPMIFFSIL